MLYLVKISMLSSFVKLVLLLLVFILVLVAAYWFTRWYAKTGMVQQRNKNIEVEEVFSMGPGKQIMILRVGRKYLAVASCKEQLQILAELKEEDLDLEEAQTSQSAPFKEIFSGMLHDKVKKKNNSRE